MKHFFKLIRFLLLPAFRPVMGWDDLLYGLAMYAGKAAISKEMQPKTDTPGQTPTMATMDLNALLDQAKQGQAKQDELAMTPNKLHFNQYA